MSDRTQDLMNLDLNLGPMAPTTSPVIALRQRSRPRWRGRHHQLPWETRSPRMMVESGDNNGDGVVDSRNHPTPLQVGEGSLSTEERSHEMAKMCENYATQLENDSIDNKEDVEKTSIEEGSLFDCNICLDLAKEPVVTCCGHLFCWPCIYSWLHIHSDAKECPVCKGEVTFKNVTPIYGRGNHTREPEEDSSGNKIPVRPSACRVESLRQAIQRTTSSLSEGMIRRIGARFDLARDFFQLPESDSNRDPIHRSSMLNILTSHSRIVSQREPNPTIFSEDLVDLGQDRVELMGRLRLPPLTYRRGQSQSQSQSHRTLEDQLPPVDLDRDSFSSIGAVIHGESQILDTTVEIDSPIFLSTSSSRRRNEISRASDVDSRDSRALRRRRLN